MVSLAASERHLSASIPLPASKSESNRAIILRALSREKIELHNLSDARDTQTLLRLLDSEGLVLDVIDAGTTMRFLTAYLAVSGRDQILTGSPRMCQRPIGILVEALRSLGAEIEYRNQAGYPPLHIISKGSRMHGGELSMQGNVSSQFISALLMIAPLLSGGLRLRLEGEISSLPYIELTRSLMQHFGAETSWTDSSSIYVAERPYRGGSYQIESDWSAASYWYSLAALSEGCDLLLKGLRPGSWQGDSILAQWMEPLGVITAFEAEGARLRKNGHPLPQRLDLDLRSQPDLAQTFAVLAPALGIDLRLTGLHTLRIKETDRLAALQAELGKLGAACETGEDFLETRGPLQPAGIPLIETYDDHRMAMAFAPLAFRLPELRIAQAEVVAKSYPQFWRHLAAAGIRVSGDQ
jgi:3-phosphoshikimate 1-carboxyvinyltransferase